MLDFTKLSARIAYVLQQERDNRLNAISGYLELLKQKNSPKIIPALQKILIVPHARLFNPGHYTNLEQFLRQLNIENPVLSQQLQVLVQQLHPALQQVQQAVQVLQLLAVIQILYLN